MKRTDNNSPYDLLLLALIGLLISFAVVLPSLSLRNQMHERLLLREAATLQALVNLQVHLEGEKLNSLGLSDEKMDPLPALLQTTKLGGILGLRYWADTREGAVLIPATLSDASMSEQDWDRLNKDGRLVYFSHNKEIPVVDDLDSASNAMMAIAEITITLSGHSPAAPHAVQFVLSGEEIAAEFSAMDQQLILKTGLLWLCVEALALSGTLFVLNRLRHNRRRLQQIADDLHRANEELKLAAKISALGSVTAHLLHGLKNPLAEMRVLARENLRDDRPASPQDAWREAAGLADRLQRIAEEAGELLRDEATGVCYAVTNEEVREIITARINKLEFRIPPRITWTIMEQADLDNRRAGLISLILSNLVQNAAEARPDGAEVSISCRKTQTHLCYMVTDNGPGLPENLRQRLFLPVNSSKPGGTGIGLTISRQLALHAGGDLLLNNTGPQGTCFELRIPLTA